MEELEMRVEKVVGAGWEDGAAGMEDEALELEIT